MLAARNDVIDILQKGTHKVTFTKINGETREMRCTLNANLIPVTDTHSDTQSETREKKINENVVSVYDLDKKDWRSFRIDNLISILQE
jgi:hypothetical protein